MISTIFAGFRDVTLDAVPDKPRLLEPNKNANKSTENPLVTKVKSNSEDKSIPVGSDEDYRSKNQEESELYDSSPTSQRKNAYTGGKRKQQKSRGNPPPLNVKGILVTYVL